MFVTSDGNFHKPKKKVKLAQLNAQVLRPSEAVTELCSTKDCKIGRPRQPVSTDEPSR